MYVKVYKENNQWFREDNGALVGSDISLAVSYAFFDCNSKLIIPSYGYIDSDGSFKELCKSTSCSHECLSECRQECRYTGKAQTEGFYFISD